MKASVIIPCLNRQNHLQLVVDSLINQKNNSIDYEIIIVDDGSIPQLKNFINPIITMIRTPHRGSASARNLGVKNSTGEILIFLDCDILVEEDFIQTHCDFHNQNNNSVALGPRFHTDSCGAVTSSDTRIKLLNRYQKKLMDLKHPWFMTYTCNVSLPREFAIAELFDEHYVFWGLEDSEWAYRLYRSGCQFLFIEKMKSYHLYHDRTMSYEKFKGWESNLAYTISKHPELIVLDCFRDVFDPSQNVDYFTTYDKFENII